MGVQSKIRLEACSRSWFLGADGERLSSLRFQRKSKGGWLRGCSDSCIPSIFGGFPNGCAVRIGIGAVFQKLVLASECRTIRCPKSECSGIGGCESYKLRTCSEDGIPNIFGGLPNGSVIRIGIGAIFEKCVTVV
jgi:hypothetical protein